MGEWSEQILESMAQIGSSKRIFYNEYVPSGVPFYRSKEIIEKHRKASASVDLYITRERFEEISKQFGAPKAGELLLTAVGTLGVPYIVQENEEFYFKDGNLIWIRDFSALKSSFLYYWFLSEVGKNALDSISIGSTQPALTIAGLKKLPILVPQLAEQNAIVEVLSSLDDKIDLLHRQNKTLESLAENLFRHWFIDGAQDDWETVKLEDLTSRITDGAHSSPPNASFGKPMASVKDMTNWGINFNSCRHISEHDFDELVSQDCRPRKNDILIAKDGSYLKHIFLVREDMELVILSSIAVVRPNLRFHPILLKIFLGLQETKDAMELIVTGAVIPRIVLKDFRKFPILLPPKETQEKALGAIRPIFERCWVNCDQIESLTELRDTLLPKLMNGDVRVDYEAAG